MSDDARMTFASRCHQHSVHHVPAIVKQRIPRQRRHFTIGLLHDQIGGGKIPVAALPAGKGGIQRAVRDVYYKFTGSRGTDLWLLLGDNAYPDGTPPAWPRVGSVKMS